MRDTFVALFPAMFSRIKYLKTKKKILHLNNPQTLDEKLMYLKLKEYPNDDLVKQCADKYLVRNYIVKAGCADILTDLIAVFNSADEIDWDTLPDKFALKCNHGCGYNIICKDKSGADKHAVLVQLDTWMRTDYWKVFAELNYKGMKRKIICEEYLENDDGTPVDDYKIYCFHGKPYCVMDCVGRDHGLPKFYSFDREWNLLRINPDGKNAPEGFSTKKPEYAEKLFEYAEKLSAPFKFVRVDLYAIGTKVYFGELTFTPAACLDANRLPETDLLFGKMLIL